MTVPGTFDRHSLGLYTLVENLDDNWAKFHFGSKKGLILKPVTRELFIDKGPVVQLKDTTGRLEVLDDPEPGI